VHSSLRVACQVSLWVGALWKRSKTVDENKMLTTSYIFAHDDTEDAIVRGVSTS